MDKNITMCRGNSTGVSVLVAIIGPPKIEINNKISNHHFYTNYFAIFYYRNK